MPLPGWSGGVVLEKLGWGGRMRGAVPSKGV